MASGLTTQELLFAKLACLQRIGGALQELVRSGIAGLDTMQCVVAETIAQVHQDLHTEADRLAAMRT
jgi:hypothetical protein